MKILRVIAGAFVLTYAAVFLITFVDKTYLENQAQEYLRNELETKVKNRVAGMQERTAPVLARVLADRHEKEIAALESQLESGFSAQLDAVMRKMRNPSCECRRHVEGNLERGAVAQLQDLRGRVGVLKLIAMEAYGDIVRKLQHDFRIFSGVNLLAFLLVIVASFFKPAARIHLRLPSALLAVSTLVSSWLYLFEQNWFFTILANDYVGFGYIAWLALVFGVLVDIVLNRARVTTEILNFFVQALFKGVTLSPC